MGNRKNFCDLNQLSPSNLQRTVNVCGADVNAANVAETEGLLNDSNQSNLILQNIVLNNGE